MIFCCYFEKFILNSRERPRKVMNDNFRDCLNSTNFKKPSSCIPLIKWPPLVIKKNFLFFLLGILPNFINLLTERGEKRREGKSRNLILFRAQQSIYLSFQSPSTILLSLHGYCISLSRRNRTNQGSHILQREFPWCEINFSESSEW